MGGVIRHRKDVTLTRKRKSSVELTHIVVVGEVGIELRAVGEDVGERGSHNEGRESLKVAEAIGVFITEVQTIEERFLLVEWSCEVSIHIGGVETSSSERHRTTCHVKGFLRHTVHYTTRCSVSEEGRSGAFDDFHTLNVGE